MSTYDPLSRASRVHLAYTILEMLKKEQFQLRPNLKPGEELQFGRRIKIDGKSSNLQIVVYTTIVSDEVREIGQDAIRVALLYRASDGSTVGIGKSKRVNRTGQIADIITRILERVKHCEDISSVETCRFCSAPIAISKANKPYCAEKCWLKNKN